MSGDRHKVVPGEDMRTRDGRRILKGRRRPMHVQEMLKSIKKQGDYYDDYPKHYMLDEHGQEYALIAYVEKLERELRRKSQGLPPQPLVRDEHGVIRFLCNQIVRDLVDRRVINLNDLDLRKYPDADIEQFWQLIGYSISGYGDLSFICKETVGRFDRAAAKMLKKAKR